MNALANKFQVAIFDEFLDAFARIPRAQQKKVNKFVRKFREDPTNPSINYESISTFVDPNLRTVRIDQAYRAIVLKPDKGNVYVLLWVDHHDEAMDWAKNKRVSIHPATGALQMLSGETVEVAEPAAASAKPLFEGIRDRELMRIGVPEAMLEVVRQVVEPGQLDQLQSSLPPEAYEALFFLSEGDSLEEVEKAMAVAPEPEAVDVEDFGAALEREATKRRFVLVDNDDALEAMLDAPLEKWRVFLHPSQRKLVYRNWNGPVRVLGGAGTGKTVVAIHRAAYLAEKVFSHPDDQILFTTFTRNLAADIEANLAKLCSPEIARRIEVIHIDGWVANLLRSAGYDYEIAWWQSGGKLEALWEKAMTLAPSGQFPPSFFRDEWELVVQPEGCETEEQYRKARRTGRGVRMSRGQRKEVWPVFEEYRHQLDKASLREPEDALRDAASLLAERKVRASYAAVVVDEAQDMSTNAFRLLRAIIPEERPNDLFIVGDGHQRIYRKRVVLSRAGVNIIGRGRRLRINYRTTDEIRRYAVALLEGVEVDDLDSGKDTTKGYKSLMHGEPPELVVTKTFDEEVDVIVDWLRRGDLDRACVAARTNKLRDQYEDALQARGVQTLQVKRSAADDPSKPGVRLATMHRVKGLEFDRMVIAGMSESQMPLKYIVERSEDPAVKREAEEMERSLLYVAITRAKRAALVTAHGKVSPWVSTGS